MNEAERDGIKKTNSSDGPPRIEYQEKRDSVLPEVENRGANNLNAVFENPLSGIPREQLLRDVEDFCSKYNLMADLEVFQRGALISQSPESATSLPELDETEREALTREHTHKWSQPWQLYFLASMSVPSHLLTTANYLASLVMCSLAAAVQGMDETVNNGAQAIYLKVFITPNLPHVYGDLTHASDLELKITIISPALLSALLTWLVLFWAAG